MADRDFFDTNVLVYAVDQRDPEKQARSRALLTEAIENNTGALSTQVLSEFFTVSTSRRRVPQPLSPTDARLIVEQVSVMPVIAVDLSMVRRAIDTSQRYGIAYWDGLIIAAAERAGCARLFSEDLNAGQSYNGVLAVNPFS